MHTENYTKQESSLISTVYWNPVNSLLVITFHSYYVDLQVFKDVPYEVYKELINAESKGKYYLQFIKKHFLIKTSGSASTQNTMADKPKGINRASDKKRIIKIKIDVSKIKKEWLIMGTKGVYAELTLLMLPDGEVDGYENLGMITQDVPKKVYMEDKTVKGPILGNAAELSWDKNDEASVIPSGNSEDNKEFTADDLPF